MKRIFKMKILLYVGGVACLVYFLCTAAILGFNNTFNYFWLISGIVLLSGGYFWNALCRVPKGVKISGKVLLILGCTIFVAVEGLIVFSAIKDPHPDAEYVIVLGAKVNGTTPSKRLQERIDSAAEYLKENDNSKVIVSGGQGADEGISEAQAMYNGLVKLGISGERILLEDRSTSTAENLAFSKALISKADVKVVVVTSDFHMFRAVATAKQSGYERVSGLAASRLDGLTPNYYIREFFAVAHDFLVRKSI